MTGEMDTLVERMRQLRESGWSEELSVSAEGIRCDGCDCWTAPDGVTVDEVYRFEGSSDPGDESILFAISLPCGHRGMLPASYGKDVAPEVAEVLSHLQLRHH